MRNKIFPILSLCCLSNTAMQAQNNISLSPQPASNVQQEMEYSPQVPSNQSMAAVRIPLYDSILVWSSPSPYNWSLGGKTLDFVYDAQNNLISDFQESWLSNKWDTTYQYTYTYNANNQVTNEMVQTHGNGWYNYLQYFYAYDSKGLDTAILEQYWSNNNWGNGVLDIYEYDANNRMTSDVTSEWNGSWMKDDSIAYRYNANNLAGSYLQESWNGVTGYAIDSVIYSYDANNLLTEKYLENLPGNGAFQKDVYTYDANNIMITDVFTGVMYNQSMQKFYVTYDSIHYYFNQTAEGVNEIAVNKDITVYPNPNKGNFIISNKGDRLDNCEVDIYNMLGEKVYQYRIGELNNTLSISLNVPDGVYLLKLQSTQGLINSKIIVQR